MKCAEAQELLAAYARGERMSGALRRHVDGCAACGAEVVRYQSLLGSLAELRGSRVAAPSGLAASLVRIPGDVSGGRAFRWRARVMRGHLARNRGAYLGGVGVALAGAAAALWRLRTRRLATA